MWDRKLDVSPTEPVAFADRVYLGDDSKQFFCLKAQTGETAYVRDLGYRMLGRADADDDHIYITGVDNTLRAFDRVNGALRWKRAVTFRPIVGPLVAGPHVLLAGLTTEVPGFDQKTGNPTGKLTLDQRLAVAPAVANPVPNAAPAGLVVVTAESGRPTKLSLAVVPEPAAPPVKTGGRRGIAGTDAVVDPTAASSSRTAAASRRTPSRMRSGVGAENDSRMMLCPSPFTKNASPAT